MNFNQREAETQQTDNFELFIFQSEGFTYYFTSYFESVTIGGHTFDPLPIKRSSFSKDLTEGVVRCNIQIPVTTFFIQYIASYPVLPITVEIRKYYIADTSQSGLVFYGNVNSFSVQKPIVNVECVSSIDELNRKVPRVIIQSLCNNVFGGPVCGINLAGYTSVETVLNVSDDGRTLRLTGIAAWYGDWGGYNQGIITYNYDRRFITEQFNDEIQIHFPFRDLAAGDNVEVTPGCDKSGLTCRYKFVNNLAQYVGMPYVPLGSNPVNWGVD